MNFMKNFMKNLLKKLLELFVKMLYSLEWRLYQWCVSIVKRYIDNDVWFMKACFVCIVVLSLDFVIFFIIANGLGFEALADLMNYLRYKYDINLFEVILPNKYTVVVKLRLEKLIFEGFYDQLNEASDIHYKRMFMRFMHNTIVTIFITYKGLIILKLQILFFLILLSFLCVLKYIALFERGLLEFRKNND